MEHVRGLSRPTENLEPVQELSSEIRTLSYLLYFPLLDEKGWRERSAGTFRV
jgi:hypothetical protein